MLMHENHVDPSVILASDRFLLYLERSCQYFTLAFGMTKVGIILIFWAVQPEVT